MLLNCLYVNPSISHKVPCHCVSVKLISFINIPHNESYIVEEVWSSSPVTKARLDKPLMSGSMSGSLFKHYKPLGFYKKQKRLI